DFLTQPAAHHAYTSFPDVRLTRGEATKIAAYVRSKQPAAANAAVAMRGNATAGQAVVAASCVACHASPGVTAAAPQAPAFEAMSRGDWSVRGCVAENRGRAPDLRLTTEQKNLLHAFRNADRDVGIQSLRRFAPWEYATSQMKQLNCVECHSGNSKVPEIAFAGEKFDRAWLEALLAGKHPTKTRGWLEARMPAFASRAQVLAQGIAARQGAPLAEVAKVPAPAADRVALGAKIAGTEGYSCVACHDAGSRKALQVFEGQGPNLRDAPNRLRYDYYQRWMHWPQRIAPTTIMPRYTKDRDHAVSDAHFGGDAEKQFEAVWQWMQSL
ncbi:MAG: hypothetical protein V4773_27430, partial [Verrucomicrobiota bacterium]